MSRKLNIAICALALSLTACTEGIESTEPTLSPYISKVYEYLPAPGQYVNSLPACGESESAEDIIAKIEAGFIGKGQGTAITLGGFGGYVVFGFDHTVENREGLCDFRIYGNATSNSSEPGIVMVSRDENGNGLPDDEWYEIWGSAHSDDSTTHNYSITYQATTNDEGGLVITWSDNQGESGNIEINSYHQNSYFPAWVTDSKLTFSGTRLKDSAENTSAEGEAPYWQFTALEYGYADNAPNSDDNSAIDISWAVRSDGTAAELEGIDFVKVYCSQNQIAGWLGDVSTEVAGAEDLHMLGAKISSLFD